MSAVSQAGISQVEISERRNSIPNRMVVELLLAVVGAFMVVLAVFLIRAGKDNQWQGVVIGLGSAISAGAILAILETVFHADIESLLTPTINNTVRKIDSDAVALEHRMQDIGQDMQGRMKIVQDTMQEVTGTVQTRLYEHLSQMNAQLELYNAGVESATANRDLRAVFKKAAKARSLDMMFSTGHSAFYVHGPEIKNLIEKGCRVRVLIANPENEYWTKKEVTQAQGPGIDARSQIKEVLTIIEEQWIREDWMNRPPNSRIKGVGSIETRMYEHVPTCSIVILDGERCWVTTYLPYSNSPNVPAFEVVKRADRANEDLFSQYRSTFNTVWNYAKTQKRREATFSFGTAHQGQYWSTVSPTGNRLMANGRKPVRKVSKASNRVSAQTVVPNR